MPPQVGHLTASKPYICQFCIELTTQPTMPTDWDYRLVIDGWQGPEHLDDRCPFIDAWY